MIAFTPKIMRKLIVTVAAVAALAIPAASMAGDFTGVSTNDNLNDAIGFCVSAGNYNALQAGTTTGADRSSRASQPGANAALIHNAVEICKTWETPYAPPGQ